MSARWRRGESRARRQRAFRHGRARRRPGGAAGAGAGAAGRHVSTLSARVQRQEHIIYPQVIGWIAEGRLRLATGRPARRPAARCRPRSGSRETRRHDSKHCACVLACTLTGLRLRGGRTLRPFQASFDGHLARHHCRPRELELRQDAAGVAGPTSSHNRAARPVPPACRRRPDADEPHELDPRWRAAAALHGDVTPTAATAQA